MWVHNSKCPHHRRRHQHPPCHAALRHHAGVRHQGEPGDPGGGNEHRLPQCRFPSVVRPRGLELALHQYHQPGQPQRHKFASTVTDYSQALVSIMVSGRPNSGTCPTWGMPKSPSVIRVGRGLKRLTRRRLSSRSGTGPPSRATAGPQGRSRRAAAAGRSQRGGRRARPCRTGGALEHAQQEDVALRAGLLDTAHGSGRHRAAPLVSPHHGRWLRRR